MFIVLVETKEALALYNIERISKLRNNTTFSIRFDTMAGMGDTTFETPILFLVFNRPEETRQVFEAIRALRPTRFFVAADGPRAGRDDDAENCRRTREIVSAVDWPCELKTLFRDKNLGCKYSVSGAIDWFFGSVEEGIILEDDDLPDPSFFPYCRELLEKYRDDAHVMHIAGNNFQIGNESFACDGSYYFSRIPLGWGWATWRRAWRHYRVEADQWPEMKKQKALCKLFDDGAVAYRFGNLFDQYYKRAIDSFDGQWTLACLREGALSINPRTTLVTNIGFGTEATHMRPGRLDRTYVNMPRQSIGLPLAHPQTVEINRQADAYVYGSFFGVNRNWREKLKWRLKSSLPGPYLFFKHALYRLLGKEIDVESERLLIC